MKVQHKQGVSRGYLKESIRQLHKKQARVGFFSTSTYPDGTPVAYVATIQEFGTDKTPIGPIPARPFFRPAMTDNKEEWADIMRQGAAAVLNGKITTHRMLMQFGQSAAGAVKESIASVQSPPLSQLTLEIRQLKKKGKTITGSVVRGAARDLAENGPTASGVSSKPLVDSGYMISQVSNDVVTK